MEEKNWSDVFPMTALMLVVPVGATMPPFGLKKHEHILAGMGLILVIAALIYRVVMRRMGPNAYRAVRGRAVAAGFLFVSGMSVALVLFDFGIGLLSILYLGLLALGIMSAASANGETLAMARGLTAAASAQGVALAYFASFLVLWGRGWGGEWPEVIGGVVKDCLGTAGCGVLLGWAAWRYHGFAREEAAAAGEG